MNCFLSDNLEIMEVLFKVYIDRGVTLTKLENHLEAKDSLKKGINIITTYKLDIEENLIAWAYTQFANCLDYLNEINEAVRFYDKSIDIYKNLLSYYNSTRIKDELSSVYLNKAICLKKLSKPRRRSFKIVKQLCANKTRFNR